MTDQNGVFHSRAPDNLGPLWSHIADTYLDPHTQYRKKTTAIVQADMSSGLRVPVTCTSGTRPASPSSGDLIWETDTTRGVVYDGSTWRPVFGAMPKVRVRSTTGGQSIANASLIAVNLRNLVNGGTEDYDTDAMHDMSANGTRYVATYTGRYKLRANGTWASNATGTRAVWWEKNRAGTSGGTRYGISEVGANGSSTTAQIAVDEIDLVAGDYMEVFVFQNSGGVLAFMNSTSDSIQMEMVGW